MRRMPVSTLTELVLALREGREHGDGEKVVFFLDQFEQWLLATRDGSEPSLETALRHCDGKAVQCVLMVRDDFGMAAMRFMNNLEIPVVEGHNYAVVDLFDARHAAKVLTMFGRAFGLLPENGPLSASHLKWLISDRAFARCRTRRTSGYPRGAHALEGADEPGAGGRRERQNRADGPSSSCRVRAGCPRSGERACGPGRR